MRRPVLAAVVTLAVTGIVLGGLELYLGGRVHWGVTAGGVPLGGLPFAEAAAVIERGAADAAARVVLVRAGELSLRSSLRDLGWTSDAGATLGAVVAVGRQGSPFERLTERWTALTTGHEVRLASTFSQTRLRARLESIARPLAREAQNARLILKAGRYVVRADRPGARVDAESAIRALASDPTLDSLVLESLPVAASVTAARLEPLAREANARLRSIELRYAIPAKGPAGIRRQTLSIGLVADLFFVRKDGLTPDRPAIERVASSLAARWDQEPVNARYAAGADGGLIVRPDRAGWKLDLAASADALERVVMDPEDDVVDLRVTARAPRLAAADLPPPDSLVELSSATTAFKGSSLPRATNVAVSARRLDGQVVGPGEVFSFNDAIGEIALESGFKSALVISNGRTVEGVGGGVCQVSTTAFRALYKAGLPIVERNQHAYRVSWYEPIAGLDAAVYQPSRDLRMRNDTSGPIIVRSSVDDARGTVTVRLFGLPADRTVTISTPKILSRTPFPPASYQVDASLLPGQRKQVDWAVDGYKVEVVRTIRDAAGSRSDVLKTSYRPWRAVYLVGPPRNQDQRVPGPRDQARTRQNGKTGTRVTARR